MSCAHGTATSEGRGQRRFVKLQQSDWDIGNSADRHGQMMLD